MLWREALFFFFSRFVAINKQKQFVLAVKVNLHKHAIDSRNTQLIKNMV